MHLGKLIYDYRVKHDLSMDDFANRAGLSKAYVSMLEKNENSRSKQPISPSLETIKAVSKVIGLDFDTVINIIDGETMVKISPQHRRLSTNEERLLEPYRLLNDEGQEKVINYADDLVDSGKYTLKDSKDDSQADGDISFIDEEPLPYVADAGFKITQEERDLLKDLANRIKEEDV